MRSREVSGKDIPDEQAIFTAAWMFLKRFYYLKQDSPPDDWNECMKNFSSVFRMGKDDATKELSAGIATAVFRYIEKKSKENV